MKETDRQLTEAGAALAEALERKKLTITTAESCTGGWIAKILTDRPGSSAYFLAGLVTYSNDAKRAILGAHHGTLEQHGVVSEPVVRQMVKGAVAATGANVAVATSGIAGPGGGSEDKPVGTVWVAWGTGQHNTKASVQYFEGDRDQVRRQLILYVLEGVTRFIETL